jgi:HSP20 family protein
MGNKKEDDRIEIDFGQGKISFGGLFKGVGNLIDLVSKASEQGMHKEGEIPGLPKGAKGIYGFSVRTMEGKPIVETFGNLKETASGPMVEEVRDPIVDVFDEGSRILVIAELPGVSEDEIKIEVVGDILSLDAAGADRKYAKEMLLPSKVKAASLVRSYRNGILEMTLDKDT